MDKVNTLSRGTQIFAASAVLLLIDTFFHWQSIDLPAPFGDVGRSGWHGFWGIILGLLTLAAIAWVVVRLVQPDLLRSVRVPEGTLALGLGFLILVFAVLKNVIDDYSAWPAYVGVVLAAGVAFGGWTVAQEQGGTEKAMGWRPSGMSSGESATAPPPAPEPPPPAPEPTPPEPEQSTWSPAPEEPAQPAEEPTWTPTPEEPAQPAEESTWTPTPEEPSTPPESPPEEER